MHIYLLLLTCLEEVDDVIEPKEPDWLAGGGGSVTDSGDLCNIQ